MQDIKANPTPEILILPDPEALYRRSAAELARQAQAAVAARGRFTLALSGGSTPQGLYRLLAQDPALRAQVPWERTLFFWGDERHVPPDHPSSNYRAAHELLLSALPLGAGQVFRIRGELADPLQAADEYEQALRSAFGLPPGECPRFDLVLLGLGADGHTASLFPGSPALSVRDRLVLADWVEKLGAWRITLTLPVLNAAARVLFLVAGADKAAAVQAVLAGPRDPLRWPAQLVQPEQGRLVWLLDAAAAARLPAAE